MPDSIRPVTDTAARSPRSRPMSAPGSGISQAAVRAPGTTRSSGQAEFRDLFADEYQGVVRTVFLVLRDWERSEEVTQQAFT